MINPLPTSRFWLRIGSLLLLGCTCVQCAEVPIVPADPTPEIRTQWDRFITHWENEAADSLAAFYTEDGINVPPEFAVNRGREAIAAFYALLFENNRSSEYTHRIESLSYADDMAIEYGSFTVDWVRNDSTTWTFRARSLTHWTRTADGDWQIAALIFNSPPVEPVE
jgi:uncharacterized protein (TIGR02246 family)